MLKRGELKRETETILCGAQEQSLRVNAIYSIDKTSDTTLHYTTLRSRLCNEKTESITHNCEYVFNFC